MKKYNFILELTNGIKLEQELNNPAFADFLYGVIKTSGEEITKDTIKALGREDSSKDVKATLWLEKGHLEPVFKDVKALAEYDNYLNEIILKEF